MCREEFIDCEGLAVQEAAQAKDFTHHPTQEHSSTWGVSPPAGHGSPGVVEGLPYEYPLASGEAGKYAIPRALTSIQRQGLPLGLVWVPSLFERAEEARVFAIDSKGMSMCVWFDPGIAKGLHADANQIEGYFSSDQRELRMRSPP